MHFNPKNTNYMILCCCWVFFRWMMEKCMCFIQQKKIHQFMWNVSYAFCEGYKKPYSIVNWDMVVLNFSCFSTIRNETFIDLPRVLLAHFMQSVWFLLNDDCMSVFFRLSLMLRLFGVFISIAVAYNEPVSLWL